MSLLPNTSDPSGGFLTAKQAALRLGVTDKMVYKMFRAGKLLGVKVEGAVRIFASSVAEYLAAHSNARPAAEVSPPPVPKARGGDGFIDYYQRVMEEVARKKRR